MIEVEHLTKEYGTVVAVEDLSFRVGPGEIVGFLGPNGAGKSSTLRILAGFLGATRGSVRIAGIDVQREPLRARRVLGYMPESAPLYPELRVREYLGFRAALKRVPRRARPKEVESVMRRAGVSEMAEVVVLHLSRGYRQRVALADALLASPPLLILDEPTAGLDPNQIREVRRLIRELKKEHTILLSTHILSEVEATCDRALVLDRGRLVAEGSLSELSVNKSRGTLELVLADAGAQAEAVLKAVAGVSEVRELEAPASGLRSFELLLDRDRDASEVAKALARAVVEDGIGLCSLLPKKASLEQVFAALTDPAAAAEEPGG